MSRRLRDIAAEGVLIAGGARAILLQIANPAVGRGVAEHSDFASDPLRRLNHTLSYVYVLVYGEPAEARRIARMVDEAHEPVHGEGYTAYDPELQLWVAATLYDTAMGVYEGVFGPLEPDEAEAVYREYAILGTALQVPTDAWPADRAAFRRYWERELSRLRVDSGTLRVARQLLHPSRPRRLRLVMPLMRLITTGLLTPEQRELYGLPWSSRRQRRYDRVWRIVIAIYRRLPRRLRHWPKEHYLRRFRAG